MKRFICLSIGLILILITAFSAFTTYKPVSAKDKTTKLKVFVHFPKSYGRQAYVSNCSLTSNDQVSDYGVTGWQMPSAGMTYKINYTTKPGNLTNTQVSNNIASSFGTWSAADTKQLFTYGGSTSAKSAKLDGTNAILWKSITNGALAITYSWYYPSTGQLAESDTVFNRNYKWTATAYNGSNDCSGAAGTYDLQNIATHEFGHWVGLDDLYNSQDKDLTMYGYGETKELKKDTLGAGDILGVNAIQP